MFLRHPDQSVTPPGVERIEPPAGFADEAYAAGLEPGSGAVLLRQDRGSVLATLDGRIRGVRVRLRILGTDNRDACRRLLTQLRRFRNG